MDTKHTPGPWKIDTHHDAPYIEDINGDAICTLYEDTEPEDSVTIWGWIEPFKNAENNARLIAAAPELLQALKAALAQLEHTNQHTPIGDMEHTKNTLRDAIAKVIPAE